MYVMFVLIGFSLLVALVFLGVFIWAVRNGQYEDHYTPSVRMLFDDEKPAPAAETTSAAKEGDAASDNEESSKPDKQELRSTD